MNYFSLNNNATAVGFEKAVRLGLAPDRGLYFPQQITPLPDTFWDKFLGMSRHEIAFKVIKQFVGDEIPQDNLMEIIEQTLTFDFPIVELEKDIIDKIENEYKTILNLGYISECHRSAKLVD